MPGTFASLINLLMTSSKSVRKRRKSLFRTMPRSRLWQCLSVEKGHSGRGAGMLAGETPLRALLPASYAAYLAKQRFLPLRIAYGV